MFAQWSLDFGLQEGVLHIVRIIASIGGAVVGWFLFDPLTRLCYRLIYRAATPGALLFCTKATAAAAFGALMYFIPLGGGGGLGFGPGQGGGPGKGAGQGGEKSVAISKNAKSDAKDPKSLADSKAASPREVIDIEILGGARFPDDGKERYYLVKKSDPALKFGAGPLALHDLEKPLADNRAKIQLRIIHTDDSTVINTANDPTRRLQALANRLEIPHQGPKE